MLGIVDIDVEQRKKDNYLDVDKHPEVKQRMLELSDYLEIAEKCIGYFADKFLAKDMLKNEDAVSYVAFHLMQGTARWESDREGGRSLRSYHNQCASWAVKRWLRDSKRQKNVRYMSLNKDCESSRMQMYENTADVKASEPFDELFNNPSIKQQEMKDRVEHIMTHSSLTDREVSCVNLKFYDGLTVRQIGEKLGVTFQRIQQNLDCALRKMKRHV